MPAPVTLTDRQVELHRRAARMLMDEAQELEDRAREKRAYADRLLDRAGVFRHTVTDALPGLQGPAHVARIGR